MLEGTIGKILGILGPGLMYALASYIHLWQHEAIASLSMYSYVRLYKVIDNHICIRKQPETVAV